MPIPKMVEIVRPLLSFAGTQQEFKISDSFDFLAEHFKVSAEERREMLASGRDFRFDNRVKWARQELKMAGLLEIAGKSLLRITEQGRQALSEHDGQFNPAFLKRYPEYAAYFKKTDTNGEDDQRINGIPPDSERLTNPTEALEESYQILQAELATELLETVKKASPRFFEQLVVDLLVGMGYGGSRLDAGQAVGQTGDGGIDGIIKEDKLGLDAIYLQAKRWQNTVGRPEVQAFAGSLEGFRARKGVFITTSRFTRDARDYVERIEKKIILIDGEHLAQLMIEHEVGVSESARYIVKKIDHDYFDSE